MFINSKLAILFFSVGALGIAGLVSAQTADSKETVSVFGEAEIAVPADFKRVEPKSRIIQHEFQAKTGKGDDEKTARVTMMAAGGDHHVESLVTGDKKLGKFAVIK